jgi:HD-like signal output (HDOD) protein
VPQDDQINKILRGISIPPQPQIMVDLALAQLEPDCSINAIADLIRQDVGLSGMIMKAINSPFFKRRSEVTSINHAISLLGMETVTNIVNSLSIKGALSNDDITQLTQFWDSSMDIAGTCVIIAKYMGTCDVDEAYTMGLFHNCGNVLMLQKFPDFPATMRESYEMDAPRITDIENAKHKTNHAVVGYYVAKSWHLPAYLGNVVALHHSVENAFAKDSAISDHEKSLLAVLKIAEHLCGNYRVLGNQSEDREWLKIRDVVLEQSLLTDYDLDNLSSQIDEMGLAGADPISLA